MTAAHAGGLRILYVVRTLGWHPAAGGDALFHYRLMKHLARRGHALHLVAPASGALARRLAWAETTYVPERERKTATALALYRAARFIERRFPGAPVVGHRDWAASALAGYLGRPVHYASIRRAGTFLLWNEERAREVELDEVAGQAVGIARATGRDVVVALDEEPCGYELPPELEPVEVFDEGIVETYYLYLVRARG